MQNKGAIRLFAILLALVCLYQLTFTYFTRKVESDATKHALAVAGPAATPEDILRYEHQYLDSILHEPVYNFFGLRKYSYLDCKEREINFGLDLKGGMNLTLEVKVADVLRALSNYSQDENFIKALALAEEKEKNSTKDFVTLFGEAFTEVAPNGSLAAIFNSAELRDKGLTYSSNNDEVLKVIRSEANSAIDNAFNIIRTRIDRFGVVQPNIQRLQKDGQVLVELPGVTEPERVRNLLKGSASLEFWETYDNQEIFEYLIQADNVIARIEYNKAVQTGTIKDTTVAEEESVADQIVEEELALLSELESDSTDIAAEEGVTSLFSLLRPTGMATGPVVGIASGRNRDKIDEWLASDQVKSVLPRDLKLMWGVKAIPANELAQYYGVENTRESYYHLIAIRATGHDGRPPLEGDAITTAKERVSQRGSYEIEMSMNAEGAKTWARLTKANIGKSIAIVLDGFVYSYPTVQTEIRGGQSSITGNFTPEEAKDLATILNSGKMPAPARIIEDNVVGPSLGKEAVQSGLVSFIWAFVGVLLYMIFYYGFKAGAIVDVALMVNVFLLMGVLASFNAVLTMPGIAGIVLTLGMAVDANVLIYERIREELRSGKALKASIHDGYKNAFSAIFDSNLTTFLTGLILFIFGTGPIKGFATTLMIGIATSFFSAVYITRLIYEWLMKKESFNVEFATGLTRNLFTKVNINFVQNRKIYFALSAIVLLVCVGSLATRGLKQGIDFTGGRTYVVRFEQEVDASKIYESMADAFAGANVEVKTYGSANQIRIATNYMVLDTEESGDKAVEEALYAGIKPFLPEGTASDEFSDKYLMSSQKIGPTVATDMRSKAGWAVALSMLGMFLYIMLRFRNWELSLGAVIGLMHDTLLIFGVFSLFYSVMPFAMEMDQSFIAAILTVIGYSINDNVVVYDRIREYRELYPKRKISEVFNTAMNSTIGRTVNTSLSTMVVLIVIFIFGSETIRGFVFAMTIGVVVGVYSTLCIASPISYLLLRRKAGGDVEISKVSTKLVG